MERVEILVPDHSFAKVTQAIGSLGAARFATTPSQHAAQRLLVSWLPDLDAVESRRELRVLWDAALKVRRRASHHYVPMVFLSHGAGSGKTVSALLFQTLIHWSREALQEPYVATTPQAVRRLVLARQQGSEEDLIASASIEDDKLVVWNCEPRRFEVAVAEIPVLAKLDAATLAKFELSASGGRLRWPDADVDIHLDTIREHADPEVRRQHEARARQEATRYSNAIRHLREERGLKQSDIPGLTDRQVRRLEEGGTVPQIETLRRLAAAHGMAVDDYLRELAKRSRKSSRRSAPGRSPRQAHAW
jgi:Asp-tRNA(Asn)/Glu-tRNA(Gln) amidotransferase A subunit family amidase